MREAIRAIERRLEEDETFSVEDARWEVKLVFFRLMREGTVTKEELRAESLEAVSRHREIAEARVRSQVNERKGEYDGSD